ncbi:hypothetical protein DER45DRAFT_636047 [Fusarium avenaceum]|nr:hypothetical protein DER45DRAFT_636047 [Fusarium avenaceum]
MDIRGQPPSLYLLMADKTPKRLVPRQGTPTVSDTPLHAKMRNHDDDTPTSQVPAPKRARRKPISKNKPNQTKTRSRSSHKKPDGVTSKENPEIPKTEPALQEPVSGIMFAQGCELIPGIGLSIPFDGNRIMVLPFDTMPPGLQHFASNDPICHPHGLQQDLHVAPDITSCYGTISDPTRNYSWAWMGNNGPSVQPAYFSGVPTPTHSFDSQAWNLGDETRLQNQSMFFCDGSNM